MKPLRLKSSSLIFFVIPVLGFLIYSNTLQTSFHLDDVHSIVENPTIRNLFNLRDQWTLLPQRFVANWTFALNYHFSKLEVWSYHLFNLLVHLLSSLLVYFLIRLVFRAPSLQKDPSAPQSESIAFFCSLIFLSHPLQTQAVTYIAQRAASLATLLYLASVFFYLKARLEKSLTFYLLALSSALAAMFTKQIAYTLPLALLLVEVCFFERRSRGQVLGRLSPFFALWGIVYFACYHRGVQAGFLEEITRAGSEIPRSRYLLTQINVVRTYIRLLFLPVRQNLDYDYPISKSLWEPWTLASFIFLLAIFLFALKIYKKYRLASFGIFWFFLTLSAESSIIPIEDVIFEHRLYLPMFGFATAFSSGCYVILRNRIWFVRILTVIIALLSGMTYLRNRVWKDEVTLWQDVLSKGGGKIRPFDNLGAAFVEQGKLGETVELMKRGLAKNPPSHDTYNTLGVALARLGKYEEAISYYELALQKNPEFEKAHNNWGISLKELGRVNKAIRHFSLALRFKPNYAEAHRNLGAALVTQGKSDEALKHYEEAVRLKPDYAEAHTSMGVIFYKRGMLEEAMKHYAHALRFTPTYAEAHNNMGVALADMGRLEEAVAHFSEAVRLNPNYTAARQNLEMTAEALRGRN